MRNFATFLVLLMAVFTGTMLAQQDPVSADEKIDNLKGQVDGIDETVKTLESDVAGLKKIKVSGYIQVNWEKSEKEKGLAADPYDSKDFVKSQFRLRRGRLKVTYDAGSSQYVLQGDFTNKGFELKDAYLEFQEPWLKLFSFRAGQFNRPNYEVEYSSSQRESPERSAVVKALYPGERDLGAMLTFSDEDICTVQLAAFNSTYKGTISQNSPNFGDETYYYMARITKSFTLGDLGLDVGVHGRFGNTRANSVYVRNSDEPAKMAAAADSAAAKTLAVGDPVGRNWFGVEAQLYWDLLGGVKIMGEYIMGNDVSELSTSQPYAAVRKREFNGYYVYLVKNLGTEFQAAVKYDSYNPNTKIGGDVVDNTSELITSTLGFGIHNYTFPNVRITLWYDVTSTKTNDRILKNDPKDNLLTARFQYKF
jgi:hypothetical protein